MQPDWNKEQEAEFIHLLISHQPLMKAFVVSLMPGSPEVDDVLQNTNQILWSKRHNFEHGTNFKAWALTTAKFQVMNNQKKLNREKAMHFSEAAIEAVANEMESRDHGLSERKLNYLNDCIDSLPANDQNLVLRRYWKKTTLVEYALETGRTAEALRASLYRIRSNLRQCVQNKIQQIEGANP